MTSTSQGKYCDKCAKQVIDFSTMTDQQILNYIQKKEGRMCGRLTTQQINRKLISNQPTSRFSGFLKFLVSGILLSQAELAAGQTHVVYRYEKQFHEDDGIHPAKPDTIDQPVPIDTTKNQIHGIVIDGTTGEPLIFANVDIIKPLTGTQTDFDGRFTLPVPDNWKEDSIKIEVSYTGYPTREILVPINSKSIQQPITLKMDPGYELGSVGMVVVRYPWWKFWKRIRF